MRDLRYEKKELIYARKVNKKKANSRRRPLDLSEKGADKVTVDGRGERKKKDYPYQDPDQHNT